MKNTIVTFIILSFTIVSNAQNDQIVGFQILKQLIGISDEVSVSEEEIEDEAILLNGKNVYYQCLITKNNADDLENLSLLISLLGDTLFYNNYSNSNEDAILDIKNYGLSAIIGADTLVYSNEYVFTLKLIDNEGNEIQELIFNENED